MKDQKEALHNTRKPDITHCRRSVMVYISRACEYGSAKGYERANFLRPAGDSPGADFERLRAYLRAARNHISAALDSMEHHQANDPKLEDVGGMKIAAYAPDTDTDGSFPASGLPHLCGGAASVMMAIEQAIKYGLLPEDPGQPWVTAVAARSFGAEKRTGSLFDGMRGEDVMVHAGRRYRFAFDDVRKLWWAVDQDGFGAYGPRSTKEECVEMVRSF